jgi:hypothetical protein
MGDPDQPQFLKRMQYIDSGLELLPIPPRVDLRRWYVSQVVFVLAKEVNRQKKTGVESDQDWG